MREILFRGKREDNGEWVCGDLLNGCVIRDTRIAAGTVNMSCECEVECRGFRVVPGTVGEYTGLDDKDGVKIFEGDVVRSGDDPSNIVVSFDEAGYKLTTTKGHYYGWLGCFHLRRIAVIGNIHDNPELAEEGI
jgi:uncharacterized phage protein (TIGR01671 family)